MKRLLILATLLLALAFAGNAQAGQAACRFSYPLSFVCYAEETVFSVHNFEVATGAEIAYTNDLSFTPFTAIAWYDDSWFAVLETRLTTIPSPFSANFSAALTIGVTW